MAHKLITLLEGATNEALALQELEQMTRDGVDVAIIADIMAQAHRVLRQLGLDPADTTAEEVYQALLSAVQADQWRTLLSGTEFVLLEIDGTVISFHPIDVINNYHYQLPIAHRRNTFAKRGLGWEITRRYKEHAATHDVHVQRVATRANWPVEEPLFCRIEMDKPVVLTVGDIATEALITLGQQGVSVTGTKTKQKIMLDLGARIACHHTAIQDATGAAPNAAVALARLGIQPSLMAWIGDDTASRRSLSLLRGHGVDMSGVNITQHARSHYHYILRHGLERTVLANYEPFSYIWREPVCKPDWLYLSMISGESEAFHESLLDYLLRFQDIKFAFIPGPSHIEWGTKKLEGLYKRADIVIMNMDEAMEITKRQVRNPSILLRHLLALGARAAVITDGKRGAYATDSRTLFSVPSYPDTSEPVDRTGAGDAFAATLVARLAQGHDLLEALYYAPINSMSVVSKLGAQAGLLNGEEIAELERRAPEDYVVKQSDLV